jgi:hypothetical protein
MDSWARLYEILDRQYRALGGTAECELCRGFGWTLIPGRKSIRVLGGWLARRLIGLPGRPISQTCAHCDGSGHEPRF